jgi:hypothetical protein
VQEAGEPVDVEPAEGEEFALPEAGVGGDADDGGKANLVHDTLALVERIESAVTDDDTEATVRLDRSQLRLLLTRIHSELGWLGDERDSLASRVHEDTAADEYQKAREQVAEWRTLCEHLCDIDPTR